MAKTLRRNQRSSRKRPSRISSSRLRLVAATTRAVLLSSLLLPTRRKRPESRKVRSLACSDSDSSPTSSRNSVPPLATSTRPAARGLGVGERAALVPEELRLHGGLGQGGAVHLDEGRVLARPPARGRAGPAPPSPPRSARGGTPDCAARWRSAPASPAPGASPPSGEAPAAGARTARPPPGSTARGGSARPSPAGRASPDRSAPPAWPRSRRRRRGWHPPRSGCRRGRSPSPPACRGGGPSARGGSPSRRRPAAAGRAPPDRAPSAPPPRAPRAASGRGSPEFPRGPALPGQGRRIHDRRRPTRWTGS